MSNSKIKGKELAKINYTSDKSKSLAIEIMSRNFKHLPKDEKLKLLEEVLLNPTEFKGYASLSVLANEIIGYKEPAKGVNFKLRENPLGYKVYGEKYINPDTIKQMDVVMQLPISLKGALMPDAHVGYGIPIGGVLATENAIIPYGVGLDIGCRMSLTIYEAPGEKYIRNNHYKLKKILEEQTHFGINKVKNTIEDHEVLERKEFNEIGILRQNHGKARKQLGTSGSGNHFVEIGIVQLEKGNTLGLPEGEFLGVLAHSGSRGLGAAIANNYLKIATEICWLPKGSQHLAWLDLNSEAGMEYWLAMNLAGDYAKACHDVIHSKIASAMGLKCISKIENHHNFAWKEDIGLNRKAIIHRKGATPMQTGVLGIIPSNMIDPGYIVSGKGNSDSLNSASHGAGRKMSRQKAKELISGSELNKMLRKAEITLIGGSTDESPMAYKCIKDVIDSQRDLLNVEGKFFPKIVKMDKN